MLEPPFDILDSSWPRPIQCTNGYWESEPEWDAPVMGVTPQPSWQMVRGQLCWLVDWKAFFATGIVPWERGFGGEMRGFQVVFRLRVNRPGKLAFWADDGCIIRREGVIVHLDKSAHSLARGEIDVGGGDILHVAQWQKDGEWVWGAQPISSRDASMSIGSLWGYYEAALGRMQTPNGPTLKMYSHAGTPIRTIVSIYSLILNGYVPSGVLLFGEHQWSRGSRDLLYSMLPFAQVVSTDEVNERIRMYGGSELADRAMGSWWVMKTLVSLLYPPNEFCAMDDDVFILDNTRDALEAFNRNDLVFATDIDHGEEYLSVWEPAFGRMPVFETAKFNAGLYWMRNLHDPLMIADFALRVPPGRGGEYTWEQGFVANLFADRDTLRLPSQKYFYPLFDGLPGGMLGYDYRANPCGFASLHFGGLREKPTNAVTLALAEEILGRSVAC
jgi:hypothetical protein